VIFIVHVIVIWLYCNGLCVCVIALVAHREDPGFRVPYGQTGFGQGSGDGHSHHSYGGFPQQGFV